MNTDTPGVDDGGTKRAKLGSWGGLSCHPEGYFRRDAGDLRANVVGEVDMFGRDGFAGGYGRERHGRDWWQG